MRVAEVKWGKPLLTVMIKLIDWPRPRDDDHSIVEVKLDGSVKPLSLRKLINSTKAYKFL